ncbi:MAG: aminoacyl-tRNA hydrolase [Balneolales bacterium]
MPLIVGLGNIGEEYIGSRHNIGFDIIYRLADTLKVQLISGKGPFLYAQGQHRGKKTILLAPTTYMNNSGQAVIRACRLFDIAPQDTFICYDDINLPSGKIRIRKSGSHGGHNGLKDVIEKLDTNEIPRLRFGIGKDFKPGQQSDYVLSPFPPEERDMIEESLSKAHDAALCFIREGITITMNKHNS